MLDRLLQRRRGPTAAEREAAWRSNSRARAARYDVAHGAVTRWRVVRAPGKGGKPGSYAVLSDREPGPRMGSRGGLHGWTETSVPDGVTFEEACLAAARCNGKPSTANMPQSAAERGEG